MFSNPSPAPISSLRFSLPLPLKRHRVFPVFLPFAGCPHRCLFCAQDAQSGSRPRPVATILDQLNEELGRIHACEGSSPLELAYYGGTFTALLPEEQLACLRLAHIWRQKGLITAVRCSTRPDALSPVWLQRLKAEGLDRIEVGVQSFDTDALHAVGRGHDGKTALLGCANVIAAGLELGIQLLPGMPGVTPEIFLQDVRQALQLRPATLRFYPCLVIEGTALADLWRQGSYAPWTLEQTVSTLGHALRMAWRDNVPVIRLSVAPEATLEPLVLAGPRHPALGGLIHSEALYKTVTAHAVALRLRSFQTCLSPFTLPHLSPHARWQAQSMLRLHLPAFCRGIFSGHKGALLARWRAVGMDSHQVQWHNKAYGELFFAPVMPA